MASDWLGVVVAPDATMFDVSPTWQRLDWGVDGLRVAGIQIDRGKAAGTDEEQTGTGQCTVTFNDRGGALDPTNSSSDFFGKLLSRPFAIAIRNPLTDEWFPLFRGVIDDAQHGFNRSQLVMQTVITAVDMLDYLANYELIPGLAGFSNAQLNASGYVFYEDAGFDERCEALLGDVGIGVGPGTLASVFTGNIICSESIYSSGDKALQVIQEACDAEFPSVANYYVDPRGILQIHGRYAGFDPDTVAASASAWIFNRWKAGDNAAARADLGDTGTAKMQEPYAFANSRALIVNAALAYPQGVDQSDLSDFIYTDEPSRGEHGTRTWTAPNLQIESETTIGLTAKEACQLYAQYMVENYKEPFPRISQLTIGTEHPDWVFAPASWGMICGADIADRVAVTIGHPGGGGFVDEEYAIVGVHHAISPGPGLLDDSFPIIKSTYDVTPASRWANNPFGDMPT